MQEPKHKNIKTQARKSTPKQLLGTYENLLDLWNSKYLIFTKRLPEEERRIMQSLVSPQTIEANKNPINWPGEVTLFNKTEKLFQSQIMSQIYIQKLIIYSKMVLSFQINDDAFKCR